MDKKRLHNMQYAAFSLAKDGILHAKRWSFAGQKAAYWIVSKRLAFAYNPYPTKR